MRLPKGYRFKGKVVRLTDFGAFVEILPGMDGLVHVSELSWKHVDHPNEVVTVGEAVIKIHRDWGDRTDRKHARIKYVLQEKGVEWFRGELAEAHHLQAVGK